MSSDERLALRAAQGDQRAFEQIYDRYHQDLYRFCLAMVGNPQDAQDALQNTMVKVLRSLPGEKRTIKLRPWLYRIARNESVETLRRRRDTAELEPQQAAVAAVTETAETRERLRTLLADLEQLPERQRAALVMRELGGLDFEQIGVAFGTSAAVARQTLYEARLSLRQLDAGREMRCADVMLELSNADGRVTRRREIRAHLQSCAECRAFRDDIDRRHEDLAALAPLPLAASAGLLHGVLGAKAGAAAGAAATSALVKSVATVAVVAVVGVSAADRSGVVDLPLPGGGNDSPAQETSGPGATGGAGNAASPASMPGSSTAPQDGGASQGNRGKGGSGTMASGKGTTKRSSSRSQAGQSPPGGGYGRSAAERKGRPDGLPAASDKGQQTAATHKPSQAASPPGKGGTGAGGGESSGGGGAPTSKPGSPPQAKAPPAAPPAADPPSPVPPKVETGAAHSGPPATPGLER